jgi:hypothetical protein
MLPLVDDIPAAFERQKYVVLRSLVKEPVLSTLYTYALERARSGTMDLDDAQAPGTPSAYGDPAMEILLEKLRPQAEAASRLCLYPTYSYFRVYKRGDVLAKHRDRPSCEISISLSLGYHAEKPWPLWLEGPMGVSCACLEPGDAALYRGLECVHWRDALEGDHAAQLFLHYVDRNGPYADWRFDKRQSLSVFPNVKLR